MEQYKKFREGLVVGGVGGVGGVNEGQSSPD
jgi:hypothetical protein